MPNVSKLSNQQIAFIDAYVRKRGINFHDVRSEIVDHLASDIERMASEQPELNYEQIRYRALLNLTEIEFRSIQKEKEDYLSSYWKSAIQKELLEYFKLPKILLTIALFFVTYLISSVYSFIPQTLIVLGMMLLLSQIISVQEKINWLVLKTFTDYVSGSIIICHCIILWTLNNVPNSHIFWNETPWGNVLISAITAILLITDYLCGVHIPNRLLKNIKEQYPETYLAI